MNLRGLTALEWWMRLALVCLGMLAVLKLGSEFYRLVFSNESNAAIDLAMRHSEIQHWINGEPVYGSLQNTTYPPASILIQWPVIGWASLQCARWIWALLSVASLSWLVLLLIRECDATSLTSRWLVALIPLSMNATGIAIGNGQMVIFILPVLIAILVLVRADARNWKTDLAIALFFLVALVKPTVSAPFFLVLFLLPGYRVVTACVAGYLMLSFVAAAFQPLDLSTLLIDWLSVAMMSNTDAAITLDYGSFHTLLQKIGLSGWNSLVSISLLFLLATWIYRVRHVDVWLIYGVTALVARTWTYHGLYDDMLIIIPTIAVYRHVRQTSAGLPLKLSSLWLLGGAIFSMLLPARLFNQWESPWPVFYSVSHIFFWICLLLYLLRAAEHYRQELLLRSAKPPE